MKRLSQTIIFLIITASLYSQPPTLSNQYILNPVIINPAYSGNRGALNISAFYRKQWVGIKGSPETMTMAFDALMLDSKLGLGLIVNNEKIGVTKETSISTNYSYKIKMDNGMLSFGLGLGIMTTNTAWSDLVAIDPGDDNYLTDSRVFVLPDFSFGTYFSYKNYFAGISIPNLLGYSFNYDRNEYTLKVNPGQYYYLVNTGYLFTIAKKIRVLPSALVSLSPGEKVYYDINAHFILSDRIWTGVSYHSSKAISGLFQFAVNNQFRIAYTYDFDFGKIGTYSSGSHEIMLRYEFKYKVNVVNPLVF